MIMNEPKQIDFISPIDFKKRCLVCHTGLGSKISLVEKVDDRTFFFFFLERVHNNVCKGGFFGKIIQNQVLLLLRR